MAAWKIDLGAAWNAITTGTVLDGAMDFLGMKDSGGSGGDKNSSDASGTNDTTLKTGESRMSDTSKQTQDTEQRTQITGNDNTTKSYSGSNESKQTFEGRTDSQSSATEVTAISATQDSRSSQDNSVKATGAQFVIAPQLTVAGDTNVSEVISSKDDNSSRSSSLWPVAAIGAVGVVGYALFRSRKKTPKVKPRRK